MKKRCNIIMMVLLVIVVLGSCDNVDHAYTNLTDKQTNDKLENASVKTEENISGTVNEVVDSNKTQSGCVAEHQYITLKDAIGYSTDIVKARFIGVSDAGQGVYHYQFEIIENVRGMGENEQITVVSSPAEYIVTGGNIKFSTYDIKYEQGESYLLLLERWISVYDADYTFSFVIDSLVIPLDQNQKCNLTYKQGYIYGVDISDHLGGKDIYDAFINGTFEDYAANAIKYNPMYYGVDYIKSIDVKEILPKTEYVLEVKVRRIVSESYSGDRFTCICDVLSIYKGDFTATETIVTFPSGSFEEGGTYIIATNALNNQNYLVMSSKNSVYSVDQKDEIISILTKNE